MRSAHYQGLEAIDAPCGRTLQDAGVVRLLKAGPLGLRPPAFFFCQQLQKRRTALYDPAADYIDTTGKKGIREIPGRRADDGHKCIRCAVGKNFIQGIVQNGRAGAQNLITGAQF